MKGTRVRPRLDSDRGANFKFETAKSHLHVIELTVEECVTRDRERGTMIKDLTNEALLSELDAAMRTDGSLRANVIERLIEVEERRLHLDMAYRSPFDFCRRHLGMSEGEAYRRVTAARLAKRYPQVLEAVRERRAHLSNLVLLWRLFTEDNADELLGVAGKTRREVRAFITTLAPLPDVPSTIQELPNQGAASVLLVNQQAATDAFKLEAEALESHSGPSAAYGVAAAGRSALGEQIVPLSESRHCVQFTASGPLRAKLERAQSLMRHRNPDGDLAVIVERALDLLLEKLEKKRLAASVLPRATEVALDEVEASRSESSTRPSEAAAEGRNEVGPEAGLVERHQGSVIANATATATTASARSSQGVAAGTRREVFQRDGEQCVFVSPDGRRCAARDFLELDHLHPRALGGGNDASNLRVLCRAHNHRAAEKIFGRAQIERSIRQQREGAPPIDETPHRSFTTRGRDLGSS